MAITPNEISNKDFKKVFRGYDIDEVDEFLEQLVDDYEKLYKENLSLKEKIGLLNEKIEHYSGIEETLQNTLLLAQSAAEQAKENSKRDAELIVKDAQETANNIVRKAEGQVLEISKEQEILKQQYAMFKTRFKGMLKAQLESIENDEE